ncbi:MAG: hypothetical protein ACRD2N_13450 [Vicinamibacterales bacterium]
MSPPTVRQLFSVVLIASVSVACGKKGPPLAPFPRVPTKVDNLVATRIGNDVSLTFPVPSANIDGRKPADLATLKVFAITTTRAPATPEERKAATLVATLTVRPVLPPPPTAPAGVAEAVANALPGLDQGAQAVFTETLTDELRAPVALPKEKDEAPPKPVVTADEPLLGPVVAPPEEEAARRYYFVVSVSQRGREGPPSDVVSVPLGAPGLAPGQPTVDYTETMMTMRWAPSPDARTWTIAPVVPPPPPAPKPTAPKGEPTPDPSQPATPTQPAPPARPAPPAVPALPALSVKSLGFNTQATLYHVYEVPTASSSTPAASAPVVPKPLTPQPIDKSEFVLRSVTFGQQRCFYIRPVDVVFGMAVQGEASPATCVTPVDTFAPQAPKSLAAIAGAGVINLIWDANTEPDLGGYLVLRGEAPGDRLLPLTPAPIRETTYRDAAAQPGIRHVYAVVAVDNANPPNQSLQSNRTEETARQ